MTNRNKKWTKEDEIKLLKECKVTITPINQTKTTLLNMGFDRGMTSKSWDKRIRLVRKKYKDAIGVAASFDGIDGVSESETTAMNGDFYFTSAGFASPRCNNCRHWAFDHHKTYEDHEIFATIGECRIRSVEDDNFPERCDDDWCGEYTKE